MLKDTCLEADVSSIPSFICSLTHKLIHPSIHPSILYLSTQPVIPLGFTGLLVHSRPRVCGDMEEQKGTCFLRDQSSGGEVRPYQFTADPCCTVSHLGPLGPAVKGHCCMCP